MDGMKTRGRLAALVLAAAAVLATVACSGGGAGEDKAGGSGKPVVLRLANTSGQLNFQPAVADFVQRVEQLSGGDVRIKVVDHWGEFVSDAEQQVVRDVATNDVDLGWVGTRVFDTLGIRSFEALTAPMLINSYALENAVIESGITEQMMEGLDGLGVVGLDILPDGLRKPVGVKRPIVGPSDWRGITFGTLRSKGQAEAIRALGATPAQVFGTVRKERIERGTVQGFEMSLWNYQANVMPPLAPYVTANVNLWPQMDVLLANPARLARLSGKQRGWLEEAARDAATRSAALADKDAEVLGDACATGARFADASEADRAALVAAFAPVYANLEEDPQTKAFIERIRALKASTPPGPRLAIPVGCTGKAPKQPTRDTGPPADLNGTYRYVITLGEARQARVVDPEDVYPMVTTLVLEDGQLEGGCFGSGGGTYSVAGSRITFHSVEYGYDLTVDFTRGDHGNLRLRPVPPMDPGDAFVCFSQAWSKIG
jgi:TRAP-type C4-dicarboxylate transport system substrate-binding protein